MSTNSSIVYQSTNAVMAAKRGGRFRSSKGSFSSTLYQDTGVKMRVLAPSPSAPARSSD